MSNAEALHEAARRVRPGGTIALANGVYPMNRTLVIATDGVTLRRGRGGPVMSCSTVAARSVRC